MTRERMIDILERDTTCGNTKCDNNCESCPYYVEVEDIVTLHREILKLLKEKNEREPFDLDDFADYVSNFIDSPHYNSDGQLLIKEYYEQRRKYESRN